MKPRWSRDNPPHEGPAKTPSGERAARRNGPDRLDARRRARDQVGLVDQLAELDEASKKRPVIVFKHSTRCSISNTVMGRIDRSWKDEYAELVEPYYLDLLNHRGVSNEVAHHYNVHHESPQTPCRPHHGS